MTIGMHNNVGLKLLVGVSALMWREHGSRTLHVNSAVLNYPIRFNRNLYKLKLFGHCIKIFRYIFYELYSKK